MAVRGGLSSSDPASTPLGWLNATNLGIYTEELSKS